MQPVLLPPPSAPSASSELGPPRHRFAFVDGLRGLAALGVAILHIMSAPLGQVSPLAGAISARGKLGVFVFFVISGFVIAHSLGRTRITPATTGRFLLRRMARLDPPYWASIVLTLAVVWASSVVLRDHAFTPPTARAVAAHALYLQYLLGIPSFGDIYWTLCFEIQFYLLLALLTGIKQTIEQRLSESWALVLVFGPPLAGSFLVAGHFLPSPEGTCFEFWYAFAAGVAAQRVVAGRSFAALGAVAAVALVVAAITGTAEGLVIAATALTIGVGHRLGRLDTWLSGRTFQYLGRISYSLYLVHPSLGAHAANLAARLLPPGPYMRVLAGVAGMAVSFVGAEIFWRLVERPSVELSRWLSKPKQSDANQARLVASP